MEKIKVGISSCLLGEEVRYNGGHKHSRLCTDDLGEYFEYVSLCPEVSIGLGIPRKPIRLVGDPENPRAVGVDDADFDVTDKLQSYAREQLPSLENLSGYIFMKGSPSCGVFRVKVYLENGNPNQSAGMGIFAAAIKKAYPLLPVEEAGRIQDAVLRENFIVRVYAYDQWKNLVKEGLSASKIVYFHSRYKYTLMAHNPQAYTELGQLVARAGSYKPEELGELYIAGLMKALMKKANRKSHTNVLMHLQGYLKKHLQPQEKQKLSEVIEQYRQGILPLIVPVTLLKHHFNNHPDEYIARQTYLDPYPEDLSLRNLI